MQLIWVNRRSGLVALGAAATAVLTAGRFRVGEAGAAATSSPHAEDGAAEDWRSSRSASRQGRAGSGGPTQTPADYL